MGELGIFDSKAVFQELKFAPVKRISKFSITNYADYTSRKVVPDAATVNSYSPPILSA